jgi:hypothetical protein
MSDSIMPPLSVDLLVQMGHLLDFKDKVLKIAGSGAKVAAVRGSPHSKDLRTFASQLSAARRWMKFGKIIRSTPDLLDPLGDVYRFNYKTAKAGDYIKLFLGKCEMFADIFQMLAEDVHTLHKASLWTSGLGMKPVRNIGNIEDRAWWVWSVLATTNAYISMVSLRSDLRSAEFRMRALNAATSAEEIQRMKAQVTMLKVKYYMEVFKFMKFFCEVIDSSITLTPEYVKMLNPRWFEVVSCFVGSVSAVSSLHKLMYTEAKKLGSK